jgi:hypothetical protein
MRDAAVAAAVAAGVAEVVVEVEVVAVAVAVAADNAAVVKEHEVPEGPVASHIEVPPSGTEGCFAMYAVPQVVEQRLASR